MPKRAELPPSPAAVAPTAPAPPQVMESGYVQRLAAGDAATERHFYAHFGPVLRVIARARRRALTPSQVEDVVQETLTRVIAAVRNGRLRETDRFGAFVVGVCERVMLELGRSDARERPVEDAGLDRVATDDPEREAASREALGASRQVLDLLAPRDREILELVLVLDADKDEVCRRFAITREHLRVMLHRAKERFRVLYDKRNRPAGEKEA